MFIATIADDIVDGRCFCDSMYGKEDNKGYDDVYVVLGVVMLCFLLYKTRKLKKK